MSNIRNTLYFEESWWDWSSYNSCFYPSKIKISDIDGIVERNNFFLVIETKLPKILVNKGQSILFNQLIKQDNWCVLVVWGETNSPEKCKLWRTGQEYDITTYSLQEIIRNWYIQADTYATPVRLSIQQAW